MKHLGRCRVPVSQCSEAEVVSESHKKQNTSPAVPTWVGQLTRTGWSQPGERLQCRDAASQRTHREGPCCQPSSLRGCAQSKQGGARQGKQGPKTSRQDVRYFLKNTTLMRVLFKFAALPSRSEGPKSPPPAPVSTEPRSFPGRPHCFSLKPFHLPRLHPVTPGCIFSTSRLAKHRAALSLLNHLLKRPSPKEMASNLPVDGWWILGDDGEPSSVFSSRWAECISSSGCRKTGALLGSGSGVEGHVGARLLAHKVPRIRQQHRRVAHSALRPSCQGHSHSKSNNPM